jgi:hypothetical protein
MTKHDHVRFVPRVSVQLRGEFAGEICWTQLDGHNSMEQWQIP